MDLLLPSADLGYQGAWIATGPARWLFLGWNLAGWVLITAVVAALTGLLNATGQRQPERDTQVRLRSSCRRPAPPLLAVEWL